MNRALRIGGTLLGVVAAVWFIRAVYLYRVWQMATIWYEAAPVEPSFWTCLSPLMEANTGHGVAADVALLRIPVAQRERVLPGEETVSVPMAPIQPDACHDVAIRYDPHNMLVENYASCFKTAPWFDIYAAQKGEARRHNADIRNRRESTGGFVLRDDGRHYIYFAAYRTYALNVP